jgi:hypothetical protein
MVFRGIFCASTVLLLVALAALSTSAAQDHESPEAVLRQIFPHPTGRNGYEDLVLAGELARSDHDLDDATAILPWSHPTLAKKRRALRSPQVVRALALLRRGLSKPIVRPAEDDLDRGPIRLRFLERDLLPTEEDVLLADGKTAAALDDTFDGLRIAAIYQGVGPMTWVGASGMREVATRSIARHLGQLTAADCERLFQICRDWSETPRPLERVLAGARRDALEELDDWRTDPKGFDERLDRDDLLDAARGAVGGSPNWHEAVLEIAAQRIRRAMDDLAEDLKRPSWERQAPAIATSAELLDKVARALSPWLGGVLMHNFHRLDVLSPYDFADTTYDQTRARLLACHAAILRFRWEHQRLPKSLEDLRLGNLAIDPYTGQVLRYEPKGDGKGAGYRLASDGPIVGEAGEHREVTLEGDE